MVHQTGALQPQIKLWLNGELVCDYSVLLAENPFAMDVNANGGGIVLFGPGQQFFPRLQPLRPTG